MWALQPGGGKKQDGQRDHREGRVQVVLPPEPGWHELN